VSLVSKLVTVLTMYVGARLVIDNQLSVGQLIAFNMLAGQVSQPVMRLAQLWTDFQKTGISVQRLGDILNTRTEVAGSKSALPRLAGRITLEDVVFRYRPDGAEVLKSVSLDVAAGEVLGIVGRSGSGKSTLTKLVQRLYVPERGRVLVDGMDLGLADASSLRRQIGVVLQDNVLFARSIRDNIALADPGRPWRTAGGRDGGCAIGGCARVHFGAARGLRHPGWRAWCHLVGRATPALGDCACLDEQSTRADI
jgi:ATP-binding cassette, subfamily B, bacterial HlyB/CyaB